jgi:hypothetical protein
MDANIDVRERCRGVWRHDQENRGQVRNIPYKSFSLVIVNIMYYNSTEMYLGERLGQLRQ